MLAAASDASRGLIDAGLQPGGRVVVCMTNCVEIGVTYGAVRRAGGVTTPVLFLLSNEELRYVLVDSQAAFVVLMPESAFARGTSAGPGTPMMSASS